VIPAKVEEVEKEVIKNGSMAKVENGVVKEE